MTHPKTGGRRGALALAAVLAAGVVLPAWAAEPGAIKRVTLSSGGLAELMRTLPVARSGEVSFEVPVEQVDDVLKSLVVIGGAARVSSFSLGGAAPVEETFRRMPFSAEDLAGLSSLLGRLQGVAVEVKGAGAPLSGTVLGVSTREGADGAQTPILAVVAGTGEVTDVPLAPGVLVRILDDGVRAKIAEASAALGRAKAEGTRTITLKLDGPAGGTADIAYVVAAPLWKTAYRVIADGATGTARLQAWAVLENATGETWDDVALTLVSGAPVTLRQRLFERYWRERPEVPVDVAGVAAPRPDEGTMGAGGMARAAKEPRGRLVDMAPAPPPMALAAPAPMAEMAYADVADVQVATSSEGDVAATFAIDAPVDLAAGDTLSVPILDASVEAERVALFQAGATGPHPLAALRLVNGTGASLPPGILTIFDAADGHLGDAQLLGSAPGESRLVSFALDRKVRILREEEPLRSLVRVKSVDGAISAEFRSRIRTTYRIEGAADGPRKAVVEHAKRPGWDFSGAAVEGESETVRRLTADVPAGGSASIEAVDERLDEEVIALDDAQPDLVLSWASELSDPSQKAALSDLASARRGIASIEARIEEADARRDAIADEQARIRANLAAVPEGSALARGYLDALTAQETELDAIRAARPGLDAQLRAQREAAGEALRRL